MRTLKYDSYELQPINGRRGFRGNAIVKDSYDIDGNHYEALISYGVEVIWRSDNGCLWAWAEPSWLSNAICKSLKAFCGFTKKDYIRLYNGEMSEDPDDSEN